MFSSDASRPTSTLNSSRCRYATQIHARSFSLVLSVIVRLLPDASVKRSSIPPRSGAGMPGSFCAISALDSLEMRPARSYRPSSAAR